LKIIKRQKEKRCSTKCRGLYIKYTGNVIGRPKREENARFRIRTTSPLYTSPIFADIIQNRYAKP